MHQEALRGEEVGDRVVASAKDAPNQRPPGSVDHDILCAEMPEFGRRFVADSSPVVAENPPVTRRTGAVRWTIRSQIIVPLVGVQVLAVAGSSFVVAELAARSAERRIVERLAGVIDALEPSSFPHTDAVLARMSRLSGAEFVAVGPGNRPFARSRVGLDALGVAGVREAGPKGGPDALMTAPTLSSQGVVFRVVRAGPARSTAGGDGALIVLYPETERRRARRDAAWPPLVSGAAALAAVTLWTGWTADRISRRLRRVGRRVTLIAEGEAGPVGDDGPRDEVADLAATVERMGNDLRRLLDESRRSERARILAQVGAGLAHQLRNALTGARISLQLHARRSPACGEEPALGVALRQLDLTEAQVRTLLSLGREPDVREGTSDLVAVAGEVAALVGPAFEHAGTALNLQTTGPRIAVKAAAASTRAALLNLALNAMEAAGARGRVAIRVDRRAGRGIVEVLDTGPGPPPELGESIFEPFVTTKAEGVGLGLALARRVAEEAAGRLSWDRVDGRTRFRIELPLADEE